MYVSYNKQTKANKKMQLCTNVLGFNYNSRPNCVILRCVWICNYLNESGSVPAHINHINEDQYLYTLYLP